MVVKKSFELEQDFWKQFLELFNSFTAKHKKLTEKELDILSVCLSFTLDTKDYFKGIKRQQIKDRLKIAEQTLAMHKKNIENKGWLVNGKLHGQLKAMHEFIKSKDELKLSLSIEIDLNESL